VQTVTLGAWLAVRERGEIGRVLAAWRVAGLTGLTSMLGSMGWFTAFALQTAAYVKALGQVELVFTFLFSVFWLKEKSTLQGNRGHRPDRGLAPPDHPGQPVRPMLTVALALAPVFLLICTGYALRRGGIPSEEFWNLNDRLVYFVLMPALFFVRISEADLSAPGLASFAGVLYAGFFVAVAYGIAVAIWLRRGMGVGTSVIQGASRFNTFVGLAVAEALYGASGLELAVLGAAVLVPVVNLTMVAVFVIGLPQRKGGPARRDHRVFRQPADPVDPCGARGGRDGRGAHPRSH
jgi:hypothetical protein